MGDWNTLHLFDERKFYSVVVPGFHGEGELLKKYFYSGTGKLLLWNDTRENRVADIIRFCEQLDEQFKAHKVLHGIVSRQKKAGEDYQAFIRKRQQDEDAFRNVHERIMEDLNHILTLIVFSECALFNPHLILGRRTFTENVLAKPKSVAEAIISKFLHPESGSAFYGSYSNGNGIINWVNHEELQLLWLDRENLHSAGDGDDSYFNDFIQFLEIAVKHELGMISGTNMREGLLNKIKPPLPIRIDLIKYGFTHVINYEGDL